MNYWLMKSEPETYSIDDLKRDKTGHWDGVRNYQARNYMRDQMKVGDLVLFYHSNANPPGIAGIAKVVKEGYPDKTSKDKGKDGNPMWSMVDVGFVEKFKKFISLDELKTQKALHGMLVIRKGMRLSVQPVEKKHFDFVRKLSALQ